MLNKFRDSINQNNSRRGAIAVMAAIVMVMVFAFVSFTIDVGYMNLVKSELQHAADASVLAAVPELSESETAVKDMAVNLAALNTAGRSNITVNRSDVELGEFDLVNKTFLAGATNTNAVKVTTRATKNTYFGKIIGHNDFSLTASAIGMINPRDIVFVVDLSGSMNDDTEPCWATDLINVQTAAMGYPNAGTGLMTDLYNDFSFGAYPGTLEYIGQNLTGVPQSWYAYAEMTKDNGPLTAGTIDSKYRIINSDSEVQRKTKAYSWIIDKQIIRIMPNVKPTPNTTSNYDYWEKYLDYIIGSKYVGVAPPSPKPTPKPGPAPKPKPTPPAPPSPPTGKLDLPFFDDDVRTVSDDLQKDQLSGTSDMALRDVLLSKSMIGMAALGVPRNGSTNGIWIPANQDSDRIHDFNNPNKYTFPAASDMLRWTWQNKIGYKTYAQFMMDWGRDRTPQMENHLNANPAEPHKTPLSVKNADCPYHVETTAGGSFSFPPRSQPMHAVRRSLIAALKVIKDMNQGLNAGVGDRVAIITFDGKDQWHTPEILFPLSSDFDAAMLACTKMQATSDIGSTTATEIGLRMAREILKPKHKGGTARNFTTKVTLLLTDGVPNVWETPDADINSYITGNPDGDYYSSGYPWYNSALMQTAKFQSDKGKLFGVGMGLGADYDFMDRVARLGGTDDGGLSPRGSGNPAQYEQRLTDIFEQILKQAGARLVK